MARRMLQSCRQRGSRGDLQKVLGPVLVRLADKGVEED